MMRKSSTYTRACLAIVAALLLLITAVARNHSSHSSNGSAGISAQGAQKAQQPPQNIFFTAMSASNLNTFIKAVKAAGLVDTLKGAGPFTVFAPTDDAFAKLPPEKLEELFRPENKERLKDVLIAHIFPVKATTADFASLRDMKTLRRDSLTIDTSNGLKVGGATVTQSDIIASNGVIHTIDTVLLPAAK